MVHTTMLTHRFLAFEIAARAAFREGAKQAGV